MKTEANPQCVCLCLSVCVLRGVGEYIFVQSLRSFKTTPSSSCCVTARGIPSFIRQGFTQFHVNEALQAEKLSGIEEEKK